MGVHNENKKTSKMAKTVEASTPENPFAKKAAGSNKTAKADKAEAQTEEAAEAVVEEAAPPPPPPPADDADVGGGEEGGSTGVPARRPEFEVKVSDMKLPSMKVAAKVGPLSDKFTAGHIVIDGTAAISDGKTAIEFTVLAARRKWIEDKPYKANPQPEDMANIVYSEQEVWNLGGTTEWSKDEDGNSVRPTYNEALDLTILLKNPAGSGVDPSPFFPFQHEDTGDTYAVVTYSLTNTAWRKCAHKFFTAYGMHLRQNWLKGGFEMTTGSTTVSGNPVVVPEIRYGQMHSEDFIEWIESLIPNRKKD